MIDALPLLLGPEGYQISRSVRLRSSASAYLNRTPASAGNRKTWTWSGWVKRGSLGVGALISAGTLNSETYLGHNGNSGFEFYDQTAGVTNVYLRNTTNFLRRDPSAWYHYVIAVDTTQATAANRVRVYVNSVEETTFSTATYPSLNYDFKLNNNAAHEIGKRVGGSEYFDGYLTEVNFIDGQALDASYFGETDAVTGVWKPKKYAGTYGTNGFYLNFSDNSAATAAAIGKDYSGNGNNWTPNNISVTAGVTYDSMLDVPTQWADGGNGRGNYAVLNPLDRSNGSNVPTMSNGNLSAAPSANPTHFWSTIALPVGSADGWYWEGICTSLDAARTYLGIIDPLSSSASPGASYAFVDKAILQSNGTYYNTASGTGGAGGTTFTSYAVNDVVMVAYKNGKIWFGKNGTWMNSGDPAADTGAVDSAVATTKEWKPYFGYNSSWTANFGQRPFSYTPPTGFKALNTLNLPTPTILKGNQYFDAKLYTGNGSTQSITGMAFAPDLVWTKSRSAVVSHGLFDTARGAGKALFSNATNAEIDYGTTTAGELYQFTSDGFNLGSFGNFNANGTTYVGWQWKEGPTQGFDIVTYTGNGTSQNVSHSLGVAPAMMIFKQRNTTRDWIVYHKNMSATPQSSRMFLNLTDASGTSTANFNNTAPTSSVFSVGATSATNENAGTYVAYLFSEVAGFSKAFSYTGNGSADGPFIFTDFRPRWVLIKCSSAGSTNWILHDTAREPYNLATASLYPNLSNAETVAASQSLDILSNGFKLRNTSGDINSSGATYIGFAMAENPFKFSLGR